MIGITRFVVAADQVAVDKCVRQSTGETRRKRHDKLYMNILTHFRTLSSICYALIILMLCSRYMYTLSLSIYIYIHVPIIFIQLNESRCL